MTFERSPKVTATKLTAAEIVALPARERDALVAKMVTHNNYVFNGEHPSYSTSDDAALEVVAKLADVPGASWYFETHRHAVDGVIYWVMYDPDGRGVYFGYTHESPSLALAITVVALLAKGAEGRE